MKNASKSIFSKFSKTSEKVAFSRKNLGEYPGKQSRCRYERRKKGQTNKQNFFGSAKVASDCNICEVLQEIRFQSEPR